MNAEYINPVLQSATYILREMCQLDITAGKPYLTQVMYDEKIFIVMIGITGQLQGQVILGMGLPVACDIAQRMMMGMPVSELNDMAKSALGELMNMIMGNAMTKFFDLGKRLDITPPTIFVSDNLSMTVGNTKMICIPIHYDDKLLELNIAIKEQE